MRMFGNLRGSARKVEGKVAEQAELRFEAVEPPVAGAVSRRSSRATGRTEVYAVRVRGSFKGEILRAVAELQLERQGPGRQRKVTEGEVMELMLEAFKTARRDGDISSYGVPLANDVWRGASELARRMQMSPAEVIERLIVERIAELGLMARSRR